MRDDKTKILPITDNTDESTLTEAQKKAREDLKRERAKTQKFKKDYFDFYDDVKIQSREDW